MRLLLRYCLLPFAFQLFRRAKAVIGFLFLDKPQGGSPVDVHAVRLPVRPIRAAFVRTFIPIQPQPFQVVQELGFVTGLAAFQVSIFYPEDKNASLAADKQPVE